MQLVKHNSIKTKIDKFKASLKRNCKGDVLSLCMMEMKFMCL
jgi:hypothetical protein